MGQVISFPGGRRAGLPEEVIDDLPRQLIIEYPATISMTYDVRTDQVTGIRVEGLPDRVQIFDRDSWHELPQQDSSVQTFLEHFDPHAPLRDAEHIPVHWLPPTPEDNPA